MKLCWCKTFDKYHVCSDGDGDDERWFSGWHGGGSTLGTDLVAHDFFQPIIMMMMMMMMIMMMIIVVVE